MLLEPALQILHQGLKIFFRRASGVHAQLVHLIQPCSSRVLQRMLDVVVRLINLCAEVVGVLFCSLFCSLFYLAVPAACVGISKN
jgi:hypothetical protein